MICNIKLTATRLRTIGDDVAEANLRREKRIYPFKHWEVIKASKAKAARMRRMR